jgi:hypothetical protein
VLDGNGTCTLNGVYPGCASADIGDSARIGAAVGMEAWAAVLLAR